MLILHLEDESASYLLLGVQGRIIKSGTGSIGDNEVLNTEGKRGQLYILKVQAATSTQTFKINAL